MKCDPRYLSEMRCGLCGEPAASFVVSPDGQVICLACHEAALRCDLADDDASPGPLRDLARQLLKGLI